MAVINRIKTGCPHRCRGWGQGIYYAVFHSISAFCNAGFDLMGKQEAFSLSPIPPICIIKRMTICPNRDQFENVSAMTSPVTHVALVDVNRASTISVHWPVRDEIGRQSSNVPVRKMSRLAAWSG